MAPGSADLDFAIVDVFTRTGYEGNPLAIVCVPKSCILSQDQKQKVAREFNLSETTFLHEQETEQLEWTVDIFMTNAEIPFAGHPTIGTACYILSSIAKQRGVTSKVEGLFHFKAGPVGLRYDVATKAAAAEIPHNVHTHARVISREEVLELQPHLKEPYHHGQIGFGDKFPVVSIVKGMSFVLVELESLDVLRRITVTGSHLSTDGLDPEWDQTFLGLYFFVRTGKSEEGATTLRTRMIERTLEDPATGSAASDLAAHLSLTEGSNGETLDYEITQGVEMGRRSDIKIRVVLGKSCVEKIVLGGSAVQIMKGQLTVEN
ncbi:Diaminopimelate epimerase-like protein [Periconia macrospinosa]|uniref:Diaminopimelate epimerase-like protein n=1 Tax=Periconia macrospinosa TaxID=97972 RepID=A0A2V1DP81_9PLEO|nr:Diaminopimelate epimerase-like protein [Periconia macrospinosa]